MVRKNILIVLIVLAVLILVSGLFAVFLLRNERGVVEGDQKGEPASEIGKPTVPGPDNIGPQGPALLPTKEPAEVNE